MNTLKKIRTLKIVLLVGVILFLTMGCEETTVTTKVSRGGSLQRAIVIKSDKSDLSKKAFPIPIDDTWTFTKAKELAKVEETSEKKPGKKDADRDGKKDEKKDSRKKPANTTAESMDNKQDYIYTVSRSFDRVEDLNKVFFDNPKGESRVRRFVELEKNFRWFYTFLTYREVCKKLNPFDRIPLEEHFTKEEMEIITLSIFHDDEAEKKYSQEKLENVEDKFDDWMAKNVFEETYLALRQAAERANIPGLKPETLKSHKEALLKAFKKNTDAFDNLSLDMVFKTCAEVLNAEDVAKLREQGQDAFDELETKMAAWEKVDIFSGFYNKVVMPGLIIDTNAGTISGNMVTWDAEIDKFLIMDYEMWVESRIVNWWAVGIAALVLVLVIVALLIGTLRRRSSNNI